MNKMFDDRKFFLVPYCPAQKLIVRLMWGNAAREYPYKLDFLNHHTEAAHKEEPNPEEIVKNRSYAFYLPNESCPLNYRELALWFLLWSVLEGKRKLQKHTKNYLKQSWSGLDKMLGVGRDQSAILCGRLKKHGLVVFQDGYIFLEPYEEYRDWFQQTRANNVPQEILDLENQKNGFEPKIIAPPEVQEPGNLAEMLILWNENIPREIKLKGVPAAEIWWKQNKWHNPLEQPKYSKEHALTIEQERTILNKRNEESNDYRRSQENGKLPTNFTSPRKHGAGLQNIGGTLFSADVGTSRNSPGSKIPQSESIDEDDDLLKRLRNM